MSVCKGKKENNILRCNFSRYVFKKLYLQEELLNGYKDLSEYVIKPKLKDYFKQMPKAQFE